MLAATLVGACTGEPRPAIDEEFIEACLLTGGYEREVCECTAEKATAELSATSRAFVVATLTKDKHEIERLSDELSMQEALAAGKFMAKTPGLCVEELQ